MRYFHVESRGRLEIAFGDRVVAFPRRRSVGECEIFEMLMDVNHEQRQGRWKLRIGPTGKTGTYAALNKVTQTIDGIVGYKSKEEVDQATRSSGSIEIPDPTYGYLGASQLERERAVGISGMIGR